MQLVEFPSRILMSVLSCGVRNGAKKYKKNVHQPVQRFSCFWTNRQCGDWKQLYQINHDISNSYQKHFLQKHFSAIFFDVLPKKKFPKFSQIFKDLRNKNARQRIRLIHFRSGARLFRHLLLTFATQFSPLRPINEKDSQSWKVCFKFAVTETRVVKHQVKLALCPQVSNTR